MAIDFEDPIGKVRLLISDLDESAFLLGDDIVEGYLTLNDGHLYRAAADALDAIATSEVLVSKVIRTQDLSTDGAKVAADLRGKAAALRVRADQQDESEGSFFEIIANGRCKPEGAEYRF